MNHSRTFRSVAIAVLAAMPVVASSGCTHVWYEFRHTGRVIRECTGIDRWSYYHSHKTGEIVPKLHHDECDTWCEPAFYGHEATCWSYWPQGWIGCPTVCQQHVEIIEQASPVEPPAPAEAPAETFEVPTDAEAAAPVHLQGAPIPLGDGANSQLFDVLE